MMMDTDAGRLVGDALREAAEAALLTLRHARVFIGSREKMHPDGQALYDADVAALAQALLVPASNTNPTVCSGYTKEACKPLGAYVGVTSAANSKYPDAADVSGGSFSFLPINQRADFASVATSRSSKASPARDSDTHPKGGDASGSGSAE